MISALSQDESPSILKFPTLVSDESSTGLDLEETITLRTFYNAVMLPSLQEDEHLSEGSLSEDRTALNHWERFTPNRDIREVDKEDISLLRAGMVAKGKRPATINKTWRELKSMFRFAADDEIALITSIPKLGVRRRSRLMQEPVKNQRESISFDELSAIWRACSAATYPTGTIHPAPKLWRVAIVMFYMYGPRTADLLKELRWSNVKFGDGLLEFEAMKTRKLQGLPLTPLVIEHLRSIKTAHGDRVFPGFNSSGCFLKGPRKWKRGYYTTWRNEILPATSINPAIHFKHFRETMVTRYNSIDGRLGGWVAGHFMPGVSAQNYDLPTNEIREKIGNTEVPDCFQNIG